MDDSKAGPIAYSSVPRLLYQVNVNPPLTSSLICCTVNLCTSLSYVKFPTALNTPSSSVSFRGEGEEGTYTSLNLTERGLNSTPRIVILLSFPA
jgi:hypothetical protein